MIQTHIHAFKRPTELQKWKKKCQYSLTLWFKHIYAFKRPSELKKVREEVHNIKVCKMPWKIVTKIEVPGSKAT